MLNASRSREGIAFTDALLDTFFAQLHGKPYYILDETATRQRLQDGYLPRFLINAIHAVSIRYVPHLCGGHNGAVRFCEEHALQSRAEIDVDEPSIDHLQALLLLAMASFQAGKGKKSYMLLSHATSMAFALSLHRELPTQLRIAPTEREGRRKLFWTCYLMDRFTVSGSKRPSLISDQSIWLRFPASQHPGAQMPLDGNFFPNGSSLPYASGVSSAGQGSGAMLVEIVRILGVTNRYLAAGGVKGDSHFPWHTQSTLSRIRTDLDHWAASTSDAFMSLEALFGQPDSSTLVLSKLIYHLVHCLIYRPFLPVDLAELSVNSQHQSWQIEATNLCFMHANAIAELVKIGKDTRVVYWPSFVGYCICTAGTIHVHGAHYMSLRDGDVFGNSADFLSREMAQLCDLRFLWAGVQHQVETLQVVYGSHSRLVQSLRSSPMRFSPVFQMEDFFDRYPGSYIDGAHMTFADVIVDALHESSPGYDEFSHRGHAWMDQAPTDLNGVPQPVVPSQFMTQNRMPPGGREAKRRRTTNRASYPYPTPKLEGQPFPRLERRDSNQAHLDSAPPPEPALASRDNPDNEMNGQTNDHVQSQTMPQGILSPNLMFSPMQQNPVVQNRESGQYDPFYGAQTADYRTPGGISVSTDSAQTDTDADPFLSFLEQLAENDGSGDGGLNDLDLFLNER